ncbi:MAG: phosphoglycerate kinase [Candidatus Actinomarina sp.]
MTSKNLGNVLIRSDLNVPIRNGTVLDNFRIKKSIEYIEELQSISSSVTFTSHLGRPKGVEDSLSLKPISDEMTKLLNQDVVFINNNLDEDIKNILKSKEKGIFLLENLRFNEGEIMNDEKFAKGVASPFDTYILDAFGASHREHASIVKFGNHLNSFQGPLMSKEIEELDKVLNESNQDFTIILGGAKVSDKLSLIKNLLPRVNSLLIGGGMCFTFLKALGHNIGNSLCEDQFIESAKEILDSVDGKKITLPVDFGVTKAIDSQERNNIDLSQFSDDDIGVDIGKETVKKFQEILLKSKTIFWNGPMGVFEVDEFSHGTKEITNAIAEMEVYSIVGGGDSVNAINKFSSVDKFNHVSTGGGASLEYLEGKALPGVNIYNQLII